MQVIPLIDKYFPHLITLVLLTATTVLKSPALGAATVVSLGFILANGVLEARYNSLTIKTQVPEELKRNIQDMNARIATIEYGIKTRGF